MSLPGGVDLRRWHGVPPSGTPEGGEPAPVLQRYPWWLYPPSGAVDFYGVDKGQSIAGGATVVTNAIIDLPANYVGVVRLVSIFINSPDLLADLDWILKVNGGAVPGWDRLTSFPRIANNASIDFEGVVRVPQGGVISVDITNNAAGAYVAGVVFSGWMLPANQSLLFE